MPPQAQKARIDDAKRNFIDAAQRYIELAYVIPDDEARMMSLSQALNCAVLAPAGAISGKRSESKKGVFISRCTGDYAQRTHPLVQGNDARDCWPHCIRTSERGTYRHFQCWRPCACLREGVSKLINSSNATASPFMPRSHHITSLPFRYLGLMVKKDDLALFSKNLMPHHKAETADGRGTAPVLFRLS